MFLISVMLFKSHGKNGKDGKDCFTSKAFLLFLSFLWDIYVPD